MLKRSFVDQQDVDYLLKLLAPLHEKYQTTDNRSGARFPVGRANKKEAIACWGGGERKVEKRLRDAVTDLKVASPAQAEMVVKAPAGAGDGGATSFTYLSFAQAFRSDCRGGHE